MQLNCKVIKNVSTLLPSPFLQQSLPPFFLGYPPFLAEFLVPPPQVAQFLEGPTTPPPSPFNLGGGGSTYVLSYSFAQYEQKDKY